MHNAARADVFEVAYTDASRPFSLGISADSGSGYDAISCQPSDSGHSFADHVSRTNAVRGLRDR